MTCIFFISVLTKSKMLIFELTIVCMACPTDFLCMCTKPGEWAGMYICVRKINDFSIKFIPFCCHYKKYWWHLKLFVQYKEKEDAIFIIFIDVFLFFSTVLRFCSNNGEGCALFWAVFYVLLSAEEYHQWK